MVKPSEILRKIQYDYKNTTVLFPKHGICGNFDGYSKNTFGMPLRELAEQSGIFYKDWPLFSGDNIFPVPGRKGTEPSEVYNRCNKWLPNSYYAKRRLKLLDWLIEQFEAKGA